MYAIIDIETTGGNPVVEKITEIAIYIHDGEKIVDEFVSLINPEKNIPYFIAGLTGISNEMVANAPKFYEVAKKIVELTDNKIFVAHNVGFDYGFVKSEFRNLGFTFQREQLCTVKLSRKLIPGKKSYSLGNICSDLGISINGRHRAGGDALATVKLFELLLKANLALGKEQINQDDYGVLHPMLTRDKINSLPEECGVYYFHNDKNDILYVGKSKNIKSRVITHLGNNNKSSLQMRKDIADISFELTGSELVALLLESSEIKNHKPLYNRAQRRTGENFGIFCFNNENGYICFEICNVNEKSDKTLLKAFINKSSAKKKLTQLCDEYTLCQKLSGLYNSQSNCFYYEIRQCKGACICKESPEIYNLRATMAKLSIYQTNHSLIIIDKGRRKDEKSVIRIKDGKYHGFGFVDTAMVFGIDSFEECIKPGKDNQEVIQIIKSYLQKTKVEKIIQG